MQGMGPASFDGVMRCRQGLTQHLSTEDLRTADIAAFAAKYIVFDAFQLQKMKQIL